MTRWIGAAVLALTLMTQTEVRIGANEREANRTFYASDSGIHVSSARTLWGGTNTQTLTVLLNTTQQDTGASTPPLWRCWPDNSRSAQV